MIVYSLTLPHQQHVFTGGVANTIPICFLFTGLKLFFKGYKCNFLHSELKILCDTFSINSIFLFLQKEATSAHVKCMRRMLKKTFKTTLLNES